MSNTHGKWQHVAEQAVITLAQSTLEEAHISRQRLEIKHQPDQDNAAHHVEHQDHESANNSGGNGRSPGRVVNGNFQVQVTLQEEQKFRHSLRANTTSGSPSGLPRLLQKQSKLLKIRAHSHCVPIGGVNTRIVPGFFTLTSLTLVANVNTIYTKFNTCVLPQQ